MKQMAAALNNRAIHELLAAAEEKAREAAMPGTELAAQVSA